MSSSARLSELPAEPEPGTLPACADNEARFRALAEAFPLGVFVTDVAGACTYVNQRWMQIMGLPLAEALGPGWSQALHPDDRESVFGEWQQAATELRDFDMAFRVVRRDGSLAHVRAISRPVFDEAGSLQEHVGSVEDVTERAVQDESLRRSTWLLNETGAMAAVGGWELDITTGSLLWSDQTCRIHGLAPGYQPELDTAIEFYAPESRPEIEAAVTRALEEGVGWDLELRLIKADGQPIWIRAIGYAEHIDGKATRLLGAIQDISERVAQRQALEQAHARISRDVQDLRALSKRLNHQATHDALTDLINRREFEVRLDRTLDKANRDDGVHSLMYLDLDRFKIVNDACGHSAGDRLLKEVTALFRGQVRRADTVARIGGDEFAVILEHCDHHRAEQIGKRICEQMESYRFVEDERKFRIGASIGVVPVDKRWGSRLDLLRAADACCFEAKQGGRNRVIVGLDAARKLEDQTRQIDWATQLEAALDEDAFELHAQQFEPVDGRASSLCCEVLIRLRGADGALISPQAFLPAAERYHLSSRIDRWVLQHVIDHLRTEPSLDRVSMIGVNVSGPSVGDRSYHRDAIEMLSGAGPEICARLYLEITETVAVSTMVDAVDFVRQVRALGVRIALDDFGAGASSFRYLKSLPVDLLKIDGQFIQAMLSEPLDDAAVRSFVQVARVMGASTVAEYVDKPAILQRLREIGVDYAQGFLLHEPRPLVTLLNQFD